MKNITSKFQLHLAVFLFGFAGVFSKFIEVDSIIIVWGRCFFAALSFVLFFFLSNKNYLKINLKQFILLFILAIILGFHWFTFFESIKISNVAIALLSFSIYPIIIFVYEIVFLKRKFEMKFLILFIFLMIGIYLITEISSTNSSNINGFILGFISGLLFAAIIIVNKKLLKDFNVITVTFYQLMIVSVILSIINFNSISTLDFNSLILLVFLGLVFTAFAHSLFLQGVKYNTALKSSIATMLEPVYGILIAIVLINQIPSLQQSIGGIIIILSNIYVIKNIN